MSNDINNSESTFAGESLAGQATGIDRTLEVLASRIADQCADEQDWATFAALAQSSPRGSAEAWRMLAELQRESAELSMAVQERVEIAARVALPAAGVGVRASGAHTDPSRISGLRDAWRSPHEAHRPSAGLNRWNRLGMAGWAVAACLGLAWLGAGRFTMTTPDAPSPVGGSEAGLASAVVNPANWTIHTPDDALRAYMDVGGKSGRVLGELPQRVIVRALPVDARGDSRGGPATLTTVDGLASDPSTLAGAETRASNVSVSDGQSIEVIYLRQIVERAVISDVVKFGTDERGRPIPVRLPIQTIEPWSE